MAAVPQDMVVFDGGQTSAQPEAAMAGPSQAATDHRQHRCLLSLDGGGVRGLSALLILENIMLQVNGKRKESGRHLELKQCDVFDLIGGTSTGGLIAIMLGRLHMDAKSCLERYYQFIPQVFKAPKPWKTRLNILAQIRPLYDSRKLEEFMLDTVARREGKPDGELAAKVLLQEPEPRGGREPDCRAFVCATAEADSETSLLRSYPVKFYNETLRPTIAQAALATTAAPTFFDKARIPILGTNGQAFRHLMDGALGANNPVEVVEQEARTSRRIWLKKPEGRVPTQSFVDCFVSIGTGVGQPQRIGSSVSAFLLSARLLRKRSRLLKNFATSGRRPTTPSPSTFGSSVVRGLNFMVIDEKNPEEDVDTFTERYVTDEVESQRIRDCAEILANKPLDPEGIVSLVEAGQSALELGQYLAAYKKFTEADRLVHRHNPDKVDIARFVATNLGMAKSGIGMAEVELGREDANVEEIGELLVGACKRIEYAKNPENMSNVEQASNMKALKDIISRPIEAFGAVSRREWNQVVGQLRNDIDLIR